MMRFFAVWSLKRGIIDPPDLLDDAGRYAANLEVQNDAQEAYRSVRYKRDPSLTAEQEWMEELGRRTLRKSS